MLAFVDDIDMQTRRAFLGLILVTPVARLTAAATPIRIVWLTTPDASPRLLAGARFGAEEARKTASLLDRPFELEFINAEDAGTVARESARARKSGALVIASGLADKMTTAAIDASEPLLAILPRDGASCPPAAWCIRPDSPSIARALAATNLSPAERKVARVVAWHPTLRRFGAGELNERFAKRTGGAMDEDAWLGWVAVKLGFESRLRGRGLGESRIDGHKGVMLRFDASRSLQQPLYVVVRRNGKEIVVNE